MIENLRYDEGAPDTDGLSDGARGGSVAMLGPSDGWLEVVLDVFARRRIVEVVSRLPAFLGWLLGGFDGVW